MKKTLLRSALILVALSAFVVSTPGAVPPVERLLPADTLFVASAPDYLKLRDIYKQSPQTQLWDDPVMKPFREKFEKKWKDEFITPLERELGVKFADYSALLQGQITLAVTQDGWQGSSDSEPGGLFLLDAKEKSELLKKNLADFRKKWTDAGKTLKTEKIRDVEFQVITLTTNDIPKTLRDMFPQRQSVEELGKEDEKKDESNNKLYIGQHESLLILGTSSKAVEKIVAKLTGGSAPALGEQAAFEASRLAVFRDAPVFAWINAKAIVDVINKMPADEPNPDAPNPLPFPDKKKVMTALGINGLKSISAAYRTSAEGSAIEVQIGAPESTREGIFKLLATEARDSAPPAFVPADVVKFQRWRLNLPKTISQIEKMLGEFSALTTWNFLISQGNEFVRQTEPDYDIRKDIFGNLGDDIISYEKPPKDATLETMSARPSLMLIGSPAPEKLAGALKGLLVIMNPQAAKPESREFLGRKIYSVKMPGRRTAGENSLSYAASGGYVAFSTDTAILEEYLRSSENPPKALKDVAGLAEAAQKIGGQGTGLFGYENQSETMRVLIESLRKNAGADKPADFNPITSSLPFASPEKRFKEWFDFSLLPPYEKISKYFGYSVYGVNATVDGITYKVFAPVPAQLKK